MRLLIFGKSGQLARSLEELCTRRGIEADFLGRDRADLTKPAECARAIAETHADIVVNAAAYTAVDRAEEDRQTARLVNAGSPTEMAREAARRGLPFLHVSTDYVFGGTGSRPWREDDNPAPASAYGRTKLGGETGIRRIGGPHVILRTAWVFSPYGGNFVKTMLRLGAERDALNVVDDQLGGPTPASAIADALLRIAQQFADGNGTSGVYHFSGAPAISWAGFASAIFEAAGLPTLVNPIPTEDYPTPARRPANSVLDCSRIAADYGIAQPDWRQALNDVLQELEV